MNTIKAIGGSLGAILVLVITQIIAQIGASLLAIYMMQRHTSSSLNMDKVTAHGE